MSWQFLRFSSHMPPTNASSSTISCPPGRGLRQSSNALRDLRAAPVASTTIRHTTGVFVIVMPFKTLTFAENCRKLPKKKPVVFRIAVRFSLVPPERICFEVKTDRTKGSRGVFIREGVRILVIHAHDFQSENM
jgi:hypothetical protein